MSWQLLVSLSVLLYSINGLLHRTLMKHEQSDPYTQTFVFNLLIGISTCAVLFLRGGKLSFFTYDQLIIFVPMACMGMIATFSAFKGFKMIEASEHTILLTTSRLWLIAGALLFLGEPLSIHKLIGGIIILVGVTIAEWRKNKFVFNSGALYVLLAAFLYACAEIISFYILRNFDAFSLIIYGCLFTTLVFVIIKPGMIKKLSFYFRPKRAGNIIIVSFNDTLGTLFVYLAYQAGRNALQIGPLMATQTIVTVILAYVILREHDYMLQKIIGAVAVVIGMIFLL